MLFIYDYCYILVVFGNMLLSVMDWGMTVLFF